MNRAWIAKSGVVAVVLGGAFSVAACGGESPPPAVAPAPSASTVAATIPGQPDDPDEAHGHRHHHHGGVALLIAVSLKNLDLTADQTAAIEKIKSDLLSKLEPARAAGKSLENFLADGVAAGAIDRSKEDAAIAQLTAATAGIHDATADALNQLHAVLTPAQRAALIDKVQGHWQKWKDAHGHDEGPVGEKPREGGPLAFLQKDLGLTDAQVSMIKASFTEGVTSAGQTHDHKEVEGHLQAFGAAFKSDTFDAKTLGTEGGANAHIATWGATRMARLFEAMAPVLTADQRTKLSQQIRDRAAKIDA